MTYAAFGMGGVGFEDVKELARQGYGKQQITDYVNYARGQGVNIGERVGMTLDFMDPAKTRKKKIQYWRSCTHSIELHGCCTDKRNRKIQHRRSRWHGVRFHES